MPWVVISTYVLDQVYGYQSANNQRGNLIALVSRRAGRSLGGTRFTSRPLSSAWDADLEAFRSKFNGVGPHDVDDYIDVEIDGTNQSGITYQARIEVRTNNPLISITPRVFNITDTTPAGTGVACSATNPDFSGTNSRQTIALTIPTGVKKYRLQFTLSGVGLWNDCWCIGEIESYATA